MLVLLRFRRELRRCGDFLMQDPPPDALVREPRRPQPSAPGGAIALEPPNLDPLTHEDGKDIMVNGSGALVRTLMRDTLLDELRLFVHPVVVGSGIRLFDDESDPVKLTLTDSHAYGNGVVSLTYRPAAGLI
jgi:dihydrofolate reductase